MEVCVGKEEEDWSIFAVAVKRQVARVEVGSLVTGFRC